MNTRSRLLQSRALHIAGIVVLLVAAFGAGATLIAQGQDAPVTFYACLSVKKGEFSSINTTGPTNCGKDETAVTWNQQGPMGPAGPAGPTGETGATGATGQTGATGPQGPVGLTWKGAWDASTTYVTDDAVSYEGSSYVATALNTDQKPGSSPSWNLLAQQGATGATGATGQTGPAGQVVASSCTAGDVVTGVGSDGKVQCSSPPAVKQDCSDLSRGANLVYCPLADYYLIGYDLRGADLVSADLYAGQLKGANLGGANLTGADLSNADLTNATLYGANLTGASLANTTLTGADLTGADLADSNLIGTTWSNTTCPDGSKSDNDGGTCANNLHVAP